MAFGIKVINSNTGSVQIDENYKNIAFISKGSATTTQALSVAGYSSLSFTIDNGSTTSFPIVFFKTGLKIGSPSYSVSGTVWTIALTVKASVGASVDWYYFSEPPSDTPSGYGMVVKNNSGQITFYSGHKYLRLVDAATASDFNSSPLNATYNSGLTYAFVNATLTGRVKWTNLGGGAPNMDNYRIEAWHYMASMASNNIVGEYNKYTDTQIQGSESLDLAVDLIYNSYAYLIADVTGM